MWTNARGGVVQMMVGTVQVVVSEVVDGPPPLAVLLLLLTCL
jgi:hypothetical protein